MRYVMILSVFALAAPAFADGHEPGNLHRNLERKLDIILQRLDKLEKRMDAREKQRVAKKTGKAVRAVTTESGKFSPKPESRVEYLDRFIRQYDQEAGLQKLIVAARAGNQQARQQLRAMREKINAALETQPQKLTLRTEGWTVDKATGRVIAVDRTKKPQQLRIAFDREAARAAELERQKMMAQRRYEDLRELLSKKRDRQLEQAKRMAELQLESKKLAEDIRRMQDELRKNTK
ncbi:MAG: hypothetical protein AAGD14_08405 [Planctomycetota bacterium]